MTIKTVETENEGLKRAFMLTIPAEDIEARVEQEVKRIAPQIRMPGFRPGKVPPNLIRKMHGDSLRGDALQGAVQDGVQQLLADQKIRPALQPQVELDQSYEPGKDAEVTVRLEALPEVPAPKIDGIALDRLTVDADEGRRRPAAAAARQLEQALGRCARQARRRDRRPGGDGLRRLGRRQAVRGRQGRGHGGRARIGPADPRLRRPAGRREEGRQPRCRRSTFPDDYPVGDLAGKPRPSPSPSRE